MIRGKLVTLFSLPASISPWQRTDPFPAIVLHKYGLGMIFATQHPKGIDNKIISNCTTQFYGRMSAPATLQAIRELMAARGEAANDIGKLRAGEFYFSTEGLTRPIKVRTPLLKLSSAEPDDH